MAKHIMSLFISFVSSYSIYSMEQAHKRINIKDNQNPAAYLKMGNRFLDCSNGAEPNIPSAVEAYTKAVEQEDDLEVRAEAALSLGRIYYFEIGGFSDPQKLENYLSIARLAACRLPSKKELIRIAQVLRQPKPYDLEQVNRRGESPLHYAAKKGYMELLELLFILGSQTILEKELFGQTALYLACLYGKKAAAEFLIAQGAETDTRGPLGYSLLHAAVSGNHKELLQSLLNMGLKLSEHCDTFGLTAFYRAVEWGGRLDCAAIMLSDQAYDAYVDEENTDGWTSLHYAAFYGNIEGAEFLINNGARVNAQTVHRDTPLHMAARGNHVAMAKLLMKRGADPTLLNNEKKWAVQCSETYIPELAPDYEPPKDLSLSI